MNVRLITFLATMISSTLGVFLFVIMIATAVIRGYGTFGEGEHTNGTEDDKDVEEEERREREEYPELYEEDYEEEDEDDEY